MKPTNGTAAAPAVSPNQLSRYVARQPILNSSEQVFGYELLFRDGVEDYFRSTDADAASRSTLDTSMLMGLDILCDGRRAFINCTSETLLKDYVTVLPPSQAVVEILESVPVDDLVKAACIRLKEGGYTIALDDFVADDPRALRLLRPHRQQQAARLAPPPAREDLEEVARKARRS